MSADHSDDSIYTPHKSPSLKNWGEPARLPKKNVCIECGWGRLLFGHTFVSNDDIAKTLETEAKGARDLALYIRDPQVVVASAPHSLFIDPSFTYRLSLDNYAPISDTKGPFSVRLIDTAKDIDEVNRIYRSLKMVSVDPEFLQETYRGRFIKYWVVEDDETKDILAVCMGIDHKRAFNDPENGSSLWAVAVDPQSQHSGVGIALVQFVAAYYQKEKRSFLDLSVMHTNSAAIDLYKKLGFIQVPVFCIKNKNTFNEALFSGPDIDQKLNPYAMIIINEAKRRGIRVEVLDTIDNYFRLSSAGISIVCRESLTELTSSIAMSRCSNKKTTARILHGADLKVPTQQLATKPSANQTFLKKYGRIVVKPAVGEQGAGITVNVETKNELTSAIKFAKQVCNEVLLEEMIPGDDLRIIVINGEVVAAAIRKPPMVIGNGKHSVIQLVEKQSRRRQQATGGESKIPIDEELRRTVHNAGYDLEDVLANGEQLQVRKAANLHVGGTIHDVTDELHPALRDAAIRAAKVLDIPVTGLDFIVPSPKEETYAIIEANERPGLANHEPQPTAQRFIDFLFPQSA